MCIGRGREGGRGLSSPLHCGFCGRLSWTTRARRVVFRHGRKLYMAGTGALVNQYLPFSWLLYWGFGATGILSTCKSSSLKVGRCFRDHGLFLSFSFLARLQWIWFVSALGRTAAFVALKQSCREHIYLPS